MIEIAQMREDLILGWRATCEAVASERVYLGRVTLPPGFLAWDSSPLIEE